MWGFHCEVTKFIAKKSLGALQLNALNVRIELEKVRGQFFCFNSIAEIKVSFQGYQPRE